MASCRLTKTRWRRRIKAGVEVSFIPAPEVVPDLQGPLGHAEGLDPIHRLRKPVDDAAADAVVPQLRSHEQSHRAAADDQNVRAFLHANLQHVYSRSALRGPTAEVPNELAIA